MYHDPMGDNLGRKQYTSILNNTDVSKTCLIN